MSKDPRVDLAELAADCWMTGIVAHRRQQPEQCTKLVALIGDGTVTPLVIVEPGQPFKCCTRNVATQAVTTFAVIPVTDTDAAPPSWLH